MSESNSLRDATAQETQLELLRRSQFNDLDGERVFASLLKHRALWIAALFDRPGHSDFEEPGFLLTSGLIKLRDLPKNFWNVDQLFILTRSHDEARQLARIIGEEDWAGELQVYENQNEIDRALGAYRLGYGLLSIWWD
jgi:hypothetical protein